jgi:hypothetical protein
VPTYLNTARHPVDLGTGAFLAPQKQVDMDENDTIVEHLEAGRLAAVAHVVAEPTVSIDVVKTPKPARSTGKTEED